MNQFHSVLYFCLCQNLKLKSYSPVAHPQEYPLPQMTDNLQERENQDGRKIRGLTPIQALLQTKSLQNLSANSTFHAPPYITDM